MVLKRLLVTTLGALGVGALAAGPASAQQIPAPDLFDDQVACSSNVPAGMADAKLGMALAEVLKDGEKIADANDDGVPDADSPLVGLNYIIPPGNSNCGGGTYTDEEVTALDAAAVEAGDEPPGVKVGDPKQPVTGPIAKDVAAGYTKTLEAYLAVRTEDAAVKAANDALNLLLTDGMEDGEQTADITAARETLAAAQTKQTTAQSALDSVGAGPINMAGIAEWRAKFAVEDAVTAWNTAVTDLRMADTALDGEAVKYADYVPLHNVEEINGLVNDGVVDLSKLRAYANAEGNNTSSQDAMTGVITGPGGTTAEGDGTNFDAAGNLIIPMSVTDGDQLGPTKAVTAYMAISDRLESVDTTVKALKELKADNKNALLQPAIDEAVRRAEAEQAHYQTQFNEMVADDTDLRTEEQKKDAEGEGVVAVAPYSIASLYSKYTAAKTARDNKGVELTTAFQAREMATSAVVAAFTDPQAFYQQLVDRREFGKAQDEAEVTRLAGLTGDDAATEAQTEAAADDVTAATTALEAAETAQAAFQDLVADDSPVKALVEELLKPGAIGDDGGALVDAIKGAYEVATDAVDDLLAADGAVTMNTADIATLDNRVAVNEGGIIANATNITANTTAIGVERGRIDQNVMDIATNAGDIVTNAGNIMANEMNIGSNLAAIGVERGRIDVNETGIATNKTDIATNRNSIVGLTESLDVVRAGVAASMALAGMPAINGRGISIGVGSFDGESAFAVGFQIQNEATSFKVGVTSSGGATGASAGVGFQF